MSTLKTNNVQVGQSVTATNNFTIYQPASPDGTVRIGVGNSGATTTDVITANSSGNVGIGTSSPGQKLDVAGNVGASNVVLGSYGVVQCTNSTTGLSLLGGNQVNGANSGGQINLRGASDNRIEFLTNSNTERMRIDSSGALILTGSTAQKATGTTWSNPSDQRLKNKIRDYTKGTAELMQVRVREWEYNGKGGTTDGMKGLGVVADEVMSVLPNTVENYEAKLNVDDEETTKIKKFDATEITWLLVKTVQEQQAMIEELKTKVAALEGGA